MSKKFSLRGQNAKNLEKRPKNGRFLNKKNFTILATVTLKMMSQCCNLPFCNP